MEITVAVQWDIYVQCGMHICSGAYDNNVKWLYTIAPGHIVDCIEFILGIYTDIVVSCAHDLICICSIWENIGCWHMYGNSISIKSCSLLLFSLLCAVLLVLYVENGSSVVEDTCTMWQA